MTSGRPKRRNVDIAVLTLPPGLQQEALSRLEILEPTLPEKKSLRELGSVANFETPNFVVSLDPSHGAIVKLRDRKTGREWASPEHPLALFSYQTFTSADFARFNAQYNTQSFAYNDFGKPFRGLC